MKFQSAHIASNDEWRFDRLYLLRQVGDKLSMSRRGSRAYLSTP